MLRKEIFENQILKTPLNFNFAQKTLFIKKQIKIFGKRHFLVFF